MEDNLIDDFGDDEPDVGDDRTEASSSFADSVEFASFSEHVCRESKSSSFQEMYDDILKADDFLVRLSEASKRTFRSLVDLFGKTYRGLDALVVDPEHYANTVETLLPCTSGQDVARVAPNLERTSYLANHIRPRDLTHVFSEFLPSSLVMLVSVTAQTSDQFNGIALTAAEKTRVKAMLDELAKLRNASSASRAFIEVRASVLAPNLSALVGPRATAELMSVATSLDALAKIPAGNLQSLGKKGVGFKGLRTTADDKHVGILGTCDLVESTPLAFRRKALKVLAGRAALAARIDASNSMSASLSGIASLSSSERGAAWRSEIEDKIDAWQENVVGKTKKALPVPKLQSRKKRGGKLARKRKERYGRTELQKDLDRVRMTVDDAAEYGDAAMGRTFGIVGASGTGRSKVTLHVRKAKQENQRSKKQIATDEERRKNAERSLEFSETGGLELFNPVAAVATNSLLDSSANTSLPKKKRKWLDE